MRDRCGKVIRVLAGLVLGLYSMGVAETFAADVPRVLIIGDSISIGYTHFLNEGLKGKAEVIHAPGNNSATAIGVENLDTWLGTEKWDVIHFNWGLHDLVLGKDPADKSKPWVPLGQYELNLRTLVQRLKKTGAKLIWCATTPIPEGANRRVPGSEKAYNAAALRIMQAENVAVNDLHAFVGSPENRAAIGGKPKDVHYTAAGSQALAGEVVKAIEKALGIGGWTDLFDGSSLKGWRLYNKPASAPIGAGWAVEGGLLHKVPGIRSGDIISEKQYTDFELVWEWRLAKDGNNGVKYLVTEARPGAPGYEYQMLDDLSEKWKKLHDKALTASFYEVLPPAADKPLKPAGEWNSSSILVQGDHVEHWLNGAKVLEYTFGSDAVKAGVAASKFKKYPDFGTKLTGHIMLTDHNDETWFRTIKIRELPAK